MNMFGIPSFEECVAIVAANAAFDHTKQIVDGFIIHNFGYNLPGLMDFLEPIKGDTSVNAKELRGITFVEDNGTFHGPYLMLNKFWCLNQTAGAMLSDVKNIPIQRVQNKLDGSLIRFIPLPNGRIIAKSKGAVQNPHTAIAEMLLADDADLRDFVELTIEMGCAAIFELIGPDNKVVLEYNKPELRLLQTRNETTGLYMDIRHHGHVIDGKVKTAEFLNITTWEQVQEYQRTMKGTEGLVITLQYPGGLLKAKTDWYENMHRHVMEKDYSDKAFIEMILDETMDDALGATDPNSAVYARMTNLQNLVGTWFNVTVREVDNILAQNVFAADDKAARGTFARAFNKHPLFDFLIMAVQHRDAPRHAYMAEMKKVVRRYIKNQAEAEKFVNRMFHVKAAA